MFALKAGLVLFTVLLAQAALFGRIDVGGARPDVVLLVPIVAGLLAGPERGAMAGFLAGLCADAVLFRTTPFGLAALSYCLTGYLVGAFQSGVLRSAWWLPLGAAALGSGIGTVGYALAGTVVGVEDVLGRALLGVVAVVAVLNTALVLPATRLGRWVEGPERRTMVGLR